MITTFWLSTGANTNIGDLELLINGVPQEIPKLMANMVTRVSVSMEEQIKSVGFRKAPYLKKIPIEIHTDGVYWWQ